MDSMEDLKRSFHKDMQISISELKKSVIIMWNGSFKRSIKREVWKPQKN